MGTGFSILKPEFASLLDNRKAHLEAWLTRNGAEILVCCQWDALRFKAADNLHIIYKNAVGEYKAKNSTQRILNHFNRGEAWSAGVRTPRNKTGVLIRTLLKRDGNRCFLCNLPMEEHDMTREHLLSLCHGGTDHIANMVLAHRFCNEQLGSKTVIEKINMRENYGKEI